MKWPIQNKLSYIYKNWLKNISQIDGNDTFEPIDLSNIRIKCQFQKANRKNNIMLQLTFKLFDHALVIHIHV